MIVPSFSQITKPLTVSGNKAEQSLSEEEKSLNCDPKNKSQADAIESSRQQIKKCQEMWEGYPERLYCGVDFGQTELRCWGLPVKRPLGPCPINPRHYHYLIETAEEAAENQRKRSDPFFSLNNQPEEPKHIFDLKNKFRGFSHDEK